jgi:PAS domain-containing protein
MMLFSLLSPRPRLPRYLEQNQQRSAALIALAYAASAAVWILASDTLMLAMFGEFSRTEELSKLKGLGFVACTSILLYVLIQWLWRHHARQLTAQLELLRVFVDEAPAAIAMLDGELRYIAASRRWVRDFKLGGPSLIGRALDEALPDLPQTCKQAL